jgi:hypothetical protein
MPISTRVTATVGAVLLLFNAQASSAQESSQQSPPTTDIPERYRRQVAPTPSTYWQSPALHDYTRVLKSTEAPLIDANKRYELPELITLAGVAGTLNQDSALGYELVKSPQELRETLRALGSLADYLERNPSALLYGARRPSANGGR